MSKDPIINERGLVEMLNCKVQIDNTSRIQAGAMMSLVDGFDRRISREEYVQLLLAAFSLYAQMTKLYLLGEVCDGFHRHMTEDCPQPGAFADLLRATQDDVREIACRVHSDVQKRIDLLVQCPLSTDQVH